MRKKSLAVLVLVGIMAVAAGVAQAAVQSYKVEKYNVKMDVPNDWQSVQELFGMPLMILGPEVNGQRPVVSVVPTGGEVEKIDLTDTKAEETAYKAGREQWLEKMHGKAISFNPLKNIKLPNSVTGINIGYRYELNGAQFAENSYYVTCGGTMYLLKTLVNTDQEKPNQKTIDSMIESFTCK